MKTTKIAAIGTASAIAVVALLLAYPAMAATGGSTSGSPLTGTALGSGSNQSVLTTPAALTVGQTLTFTSTSGQFHVVGDASKAGSASGTITLSVTGAFRGGYALSVASGSLTLNGTTYTIASGSAEMGPHEAHLVGQGSLASSTPGAFLFAAGAHANFQGQTYNTLRFDLQSNGTEYAVLLLATVTVS